jgi:hypothetical protein
VLLLPCISRGVCVRHGCCCCCCGLQALLLEALLALHHAIQLQGTAQHSTAWTMWHGV